MNTDLEAKNINHSFFDGTNGNYLKGYMNVKLGCV